MSVYNIIPIVISTLICFLSASVSVFVCFTIFSGLKGRGHNVGPTYISGFGAHHPGGIILSDEERKVLTDRKIRHAEIIRMLKQAGAK